MSEETNDWCKKADEELRGIDMNAGHVSKVKSIGREARLKMKGIEEACIDEIKYHEDKLKELKKAMVDEQLPYLRVHYTCVRIISEADREEASAHVDQMVTEEAPPTDETQVVANAQKHHPENAEGE